MRIAIVVLAVTAAACTGPGAGGADMTPADLPRLMARTGDLPAPVAVVEGAETPITFDDRLDETAEQVPPDARGPDDPSDEAWAVFRRDRRERARNRLLRVGFLSGLASAAATKGNEPFGEGDGVWIVTRAHLYRTVRGARSAFAQERASLDASNEPTDGRPAAYPGARGVRPPAGVESFGMLVLREDGGPLTAVMVWRTGNVIVTVTARDSAGLLHEADLLRLARRIDARAREPRGSALVVRRAGRG